MYTCQILQKLNEDVVPQMSELDSNSDRLGSTQVFTDEKRWCVHQCGREKSAVEHVILQWYPRSL